MLFAAVHMAANGTNRTSGHVRFSNRLSGVKHFQTVHHCNVDVTHGSSSKKSSSSFFTCSVARAT
jgi:hypothetical protein